MIENPICMAGRKILITGASSGIGAATAVYLSRLGARVVLSGRNRERLGQTLKAMSGNGHMTIAADLANMRDMTPLFDEAVSDGVKLTGLVHSAGIAPITPLSMLTRDKLEECMGVNFYSFVELVRQYSKKKFGNGGSIVGISSIVAKQPQKCRVAYCSSKAALNIAISSLAMELAKKGIRINGIMPGLVQTNMFRSGSEKLGDYSERSVEKQLLGLEQPEDISAVCAFLLSDLSKVITGRVVYADSGMLS